MANVKTELEAIRLKNGGLLTEEAVLKEAKAKNHPLHNRFTWDDSEAARQWRLEEARMLIRSVYVTIESRDNESVLVRAYASLPTDRLGDGGYRAIADIMGDAAMRDQLLATALADLEAFQKRFNNLQELVPVFAAIQIVKSRRASRSGPRKAVKTTMAQPNI